MKLKWIAVILCFLVSIASAKSMVGYFDVKNETDKTINFKVGNHFPTAYVVQPHGTTRVVVSSDNEDITITAIS